MKTPRTDQMESTFFECETSEVEDVFAFARNLEIELDEAEHHIKRLEEDGDAMAQELVRRGLRKEIDGWIAAKEAKL